MRASRSEIRDILLALFLSTVAIWLQIENEVLYSVDGPTYALIGKELSQRPFSQWAILTWGGQPFYEHPHLLMWAIGLAIKFFGISTLSALLPTLITSTLTILLTYALGRSW